MDLDTRARRAAQGIRRAVEVREMSLKLEEPRKVERFDRYQDRKQRNRRIGAIVIAATCVIALAGIAIWNGIGSGSEAVPASPPAGAKNGAAPLGTVTDIGRFTITDTSCTWSAPVASMPAGEVSLTVVNRTSDLALFDVTKFVPEVITYDEFLASANEARRMAQHGEPVPPSAPAGVAMGFVSGAVGPDRTRTFTGSVVPGSYVTACFRKFPGVGTSIYTLDGPTEFVE